MSSEPSCTPRKRPAAFARCDPLTADVFAPSVPGNTYDKDVGRAAVSFKAASTVDGDQGPSRSVAPRPDCGYFVAIVRHKHTSGVPVRDLKDRLSEYLRAVETGQTLVVTSHGRAVADLVPHREEAQSAPPLVIRQATRAWGSVMLPRKKKGRTDSVALLLADRRGR